MLTEEIKKAHRFNTFMNMDWESVTQEFKENKNWSPSESQYHFNVFSRSINSNSPEITCHNKRTLPSPKMALDVVNDIHKRLGINAFIQWGQCL